MRVDHKTEVAELLKMMKDKNFWNLSPPKLLISVIGGRREFQIDEGARKKFRRILMKAASSTGISEILTILDTVITPTHKIIRGYRNAVPPCFRIVTYTGFERFCWHKCSPHYSSEPY